MVVVVVVVQVLMMVAVVVVLVVLLDRTTSSRTRTSPPPTPPRACRAIFPVRVAAGVLLGRGGGRVDVGRGRVVAEATL